MVSLSYAIVYRTDDINESSMTFRRIYVNAYCEIFGYFEINILFLLSSSMTLRLKQKTNLKKFDNFVLNKFQFHGKFY